MKIRRFLFTAAIASLLWLLWQGLFDQSLLKELFEMPKVALSLVGAIFFGTIAGIWTIDAASNWSSGSTPLVGRVAVFSRIGIALIAGALFSVVASSVFGALGAKTTMWGMFTSWGLDVVGTVWISTQIVDILARNYRVKVKKK